MLAIALAGCDLSELGDRETGPTQRTTLDERGSYGGVGVGSSEADVRAALGEPGGGDGYTPPANRTIAARRTSAYWAASSQSSFAMTRPPIC